MFMKRIFVIIIMVSVINLIFCESIKVDEKFFIEAIIKGELQKVKICIVAGQNPYKKNNDGESALIIAMNYKQIEILKLFASLKKYNEKYIIPIEGLRLREKPNTNSKLIALMTQNENVKCLDTFGDEITISGATGKWTLVEWNGKYGWAFGGFLSDVAVFDNDKISTNDLKSKLKGLWFLVSGNPEKFTNKKEQLNASCPVDIYVNLRYWCNGDFIEFSENNGKSIFARGLYASSEGASGEYEIYKNPLRIVCNFAYYPEPGDEGELTYKTIEYPILEMGDDSITISGYNNDSETYQRDPTDLRSIMKSNDLNKLKEYIQVIGINGLLYGKTTLLHIASYTGNIQIMEYLVNAGINKDAKNFLGETPLHYAVKGGSIETVKYLLKKGLSPDSKSIYGFKPIDLTDNEEIKKLLMK